LNILVVSQYFWPENFRINDLVKELLHRGHHVTVLTGIPNYPAGKVFEKYRSSSSSFAYYENARVFRVPMLPRGTGPIRLILNYLSFVFGGLLWGPWYLRRIKPDVIFVFEPSPITVGLPAISLGKIKKVPIVFWVLDLWPETLAAVGVLRSPRVLGWISHMVRFIYNQCTLVLGQSKCFLESIAKYCDDKNKIQYFPSWAEDQEMSIDVQPASEIAIRSDCFNVVFTGNIGEAQDMPAILAAAELLKNNLNIRWIIVGNGRKASWLQAEVIRRGLQDTVLLPGHFPRERMPSFYAHANALLLSLKHDPIFSMTIPGKLQNYLMAGLPLLGMLDGEGAAIIRDANAGLTCEAGDSSGLAHAVLKLAAMNPNERSQLGKNARDYGAKEFNKNELMNRLEVFLREAINISNAKLIKGKGK
jgi:colanic acid biosynthesis glycosyl transferase WcaI